MNRDLINEHYAGDPADPATERARERIHWICSQATGQDILDIGCSQGIVCLILGREGFRCTGVDIESASLVVGEQALSREDGIVRQRVTFQVADASQLSFPDESFDTVILGEVIEHLAHPSKVLIQAKRVLRRGGRLVVTVPYGLNAFPDHKHSYYPISLLELIQPLFKTSMIETLGNYIVYTGVKDPTYNPGAVAMEALFPRYCELERALEERCLSKERQLFETATKLYAQIKTLTTQTAEQGKKLSELEEAVASKERLVQDVGTSLEKARLTSKELGEEAAQARSHSVVQETRITNLQEVVAVKDDRIRELEGAAEQRLASMTALNAQVIRAASESAVQASKQTELQQAIAAKNQQILQLEKALEQTRASVTVLREGAVRAEAEAKANDTKGKELLEAIATKDKRILDLDRILKQTRASVTALREQTVRAESESTAQVAKLMELQQAIASEDKAKKELETRLEQAKALIAGLREEAIRAGADAGVQAQRLRESAESNAAKDTEVVSLRHSAEQERNTAVALRGEMSRLVANQKRLETMASTEKASLEEKVAELKAQNAALKQDLDAKKSAWQQQLARTESLHVSRVRERDKQQEELLARREADWKRTMANQRVREAVRVALPAEARVLVVSKGDDDLLRLDGRYGMHFPQTLGGVYAGHHPANSTEAIKHLEILKSRGGEFLLVPASSFWWLDFYKDFRRHLETEYRLLVYNPDCLIFALSPAAEANRHLGLWFEENSTAQIKPAAEVKSNGNAAPPPAITTHGVVTTSSRSAATSSVVLAAPVEAKQISNRTSSVLMETPVPTATKALLVEHNRADAVGASKAPCPAQTQKSNLLAVGCILDEFTAACFSPECSAVTFRPDNWREVVTRRPIDMLFVESAWRGNEGAWQYKIVSVPKGNELAELVKYCRSKHIPTVFWNKEDPVHFDRFIKSASLFDYVFTTDSDCVPRYQEQLQHDRTFALPFAAQPTIHHPVLETERLHNVCFAGAYYGLSHDERRKDMDIVLKPALEYGLHIFDRQHGMVGPSADQYRFPDIYQSAIKGHLSYDHLVKAYKRYKVFLNVNSVKTSPTMFSRRIFELLACGTPVISAYARGIENLLGSDVVAFARSEEETKKHLDRLLGDESEWARASARGIRAVFENHTYSQRWQMLCQKVDRQYKSPPPATAVVIAVVSQEANLGRYIEVLTQQTYRHFEVWLYLGQGLNSAIAERLSNAIPDIRVQVFPHTADVATACANAEAGDYLWLIQSSDFYGPNFLKDCMLAAKYSSAQFIGKHSHFVVSKDRSSLELTSAGYEFRYVNSLPPGSFIAKRGSLTEQAWRDLLRKQTLRATDGRALSIDPFNYVRNASSLAENRTDCTPGALKPALL